MDNLIEKLERAKVKLEGEVQRYTIQARNDRFIIMTKPFNLRKTYLYTIADLESGVRGACNLIFGMSYDVDTPEGANEALRWLESGRMEVSRRNCVNLSEGEIAALKARGANPTTGEEL